MASDPKRDKKSAEEDDDDGFEVFKSSGAKKREKAREKHVGASLDLIRESHRRSGKPVRLRFEAEGDGRFAHEILSALKDEEIPFHAQVY
ncbi:MAG TPA: hypothetical protein VFW00_05585, partial [Rhodocyclaceae bacterium]|nr:hypothetical protein [Rhodocyclaceae bacterium]